MWGRRRKRKRGGQLERQLALGRLEDALGEVDRAGADGAQAEERQETQPEQAQREQAQREQAQREQAQAEREETDGSKASSWRTRQRSFGWKKDPGTNGNLQPVLS